MTLVSPALDQGFICPEAGAFEYRHFVIVLV